MEKLKTILACGGVLVTLFGGAAAIPGQEKEVAVLVGIGLALLGTVGLIEYLETRREIRWIELDGMYPEDRTA